MRGPPRPAVPQPPASRCALLPQTNQRLRAAAHPSSFHPSLFPIPNTQDTRTPLPAAAAQSCAELGRLWSLVEVSRARSRALRGAGGCQQSAVLCSVWCLSAALSRWPPTSWPGSGLPHLWGEVRGPPGELTHSAASPPPPLPGARSHCSRRPSWPLTLQAAPVRLKQCERRARNSRFSSQEKLPHRLPPPTHTQRFLTGNSKERYI